VWVDHVCTFQNACDVPEMSGSHDRIYTCIKYPDIQYPVIVGRPAGGKTEPLRFKISFIKVHVFLAGVHYTVRL
jgi:hypothetical protein